MGTAISDNIESAREFAIQTVTSVSASRGWTSAQLAAALSDVETEYENVTGLEAGAFFIGGLIGEASGGELQVLTFWSNLSQRAKTWSQPNANELQMVFATAAGQQEAQAARTTSTLTDLAGDAAQAAGNTVSDVVTVATDKRTYWIIGAAAIVVLVLVARRR